MRGDFLYQYFDEVFFRYFSGLDENNAIVIIEATVNCLAELVDNQVPES